jgi:intracellular septation protein
MTLIFHDETFIKWKPTVLYGGFAVALMTARYAFGRNLIRSMMGRQIRLPDPIWNRLNLSWAVFFTLMSALNLYVAYHFPTETWVNFKVFGSMGLTLAFVVVQALYLGRHVREEEDLK